ncbi:hypothetical protein PybrP1_003809 [[Pythium] brassicae (nom. inval.)]|nr:hypothetical protein PybrP1_003809 [[Pythium] brassicae (nom. inval.)]
MPRASIMEKPTRCVLNGLTDAFLKRMINATPIAIDKDDAQVSMRWPSIAGDACKNTASQLGRSCFKEFKVPTAAGDYVGSYFWLYKIPLTSIHPVFKSLPLVANAQLKLRLHINQGSFTIACSKTSAEPTISSLTELIMSSGSTCPIMLASSAPANPLEGRLTNSITLKVQVGGDNVFSSSKEYDFSAFKDEVCKLSAVNGDLDPRINCGVLNEAQWLYVNRVLITDCSRIMSPDVPASIVVSGINGALQGTNLVVLVVYERQMELDVLAGEIHKGD